MRCSRAVLCPFRRRQSGVSGSKELWLDKGAPRLPRTGVPADSGQPRILVSRQSRLDLAEGGGKVSCAAIEPPGDDDGEQSSFERTSSAHLTH